MIEEYGNVKFLREMDSYTFKCEEKYQELLHKKPRNEEEQICFDILSYFRLTHITFFDIGFDIYCDWDGKPIRLWEWVFKGAMMNKHVGDDIVNGYRVSTVWLGINHGYLEGEVVIFETMVFSVEGENKDDISQKWECEFLQRYSTYEEAVEGHKKVCEIAKNEDFEEK